MNDGASRMRHAVTVLQWSWDVSIMWLARRGLGASESGVKLATTPRVLTRNVVGDVSGDDESVFSECTRI